MKTKEGCHEDLLNLGFGLMRDGLPSVAHEASAADPAGFDIIHV